MLRAIVVLLLSVAIEAPTFAWSGGVHELICEMAWQQIAPTTKAWLRDVRAGARDQQGNFAQTCAWADEARFGEYRATEMRVDADGRWKQCLAFRSRLQTATVYLTGWYCDGSGSKPIQAMPASAEASRARIQNTVRIRLIAAKGQN